VAKRVTSLTIEELTKAMYAFNKLGPVIEGNHVAEPDNLVAFVVEYVSDNRSKAFRDRSKAQRERIKEILKKAKEAGIA
jgi:hypothetical protein